MVEDVRTGLRRGAAPPPAPGARQPAAGKWHLDEVQLKINGKRHWLWRAVDQDGLVLAILAILVQERHN